MLPHLNLNFFPKAVIFDMDGLMLDSERVMHRCLQQAAHDQGEAIAPDYWLQMVGKGDAFCRRILTESIGTQRAEHLLARSREAYIRHAVAGIAHRPGILSLLNWLAERHVPCAVATSSERVLAEQKLAAADLLWRFEVVVTSSDVVHLKPSPDIYRLAVEQLGVASNWCLALEDSPTGVYAALAAGITPIQVPDLLAPDQKMRKLGHRVVSSLSDVQQLLEARFAMA